jgi:hypothetical protein
VDSGSRRKRADAPGGRTVVGVAWFDREQWELVRAAAADPERLEPTHERWVAMAEDAMRKLASAGVQHELVHVNGREIISWCEAERRPLDSAARAAYAAHILRSQMDEAT